MSQAPASSKRSGSLRESVYLLTWISLVGCIAVPTEQCQSVIVEQDLTCFPISIRIEPKVGTVFFDVPDMDSLKDELKLPILLGGKYAGIFAARLLSCSTVLVHIAWNFGRVQIEAIDEIQLIKVIEEAEPKYVLRALILMDRGIGPDNYLSRLEGMVDGESRKTIKNSESANSPW